MLHQVQLFSLYWMFFLKFCCMTQDFHMNNVCISVFLFLKLDYESCNRCLRMSYYCWHSSIWAWGWGWQVDNIHGAANGFEYGPTLGRSMTFPLPHHSEWTRQMQEIPIGIYCLLSRHCTDEQCANENWMGEWPQHKSTSWGIWFCSCCQWQVICSR